MSPIIFFVAIVIIAIYISSRKGEESELTDRFSDYMNKGACESCKKEDKLNYYNLCSNCSEKTLKETERARKMLKESLGFLERTQELDVAVSRTVVINQELSLLSGFEDRGLPVTASPILRQKGEIERKCREKIEECLGIYLKRINEQAKKTRSSHEGVTLVHDAVSHVRDLSRKCGNDEIFEKAVLELESIKQEIELDWMDEN